MAVKEDISLPSQRICSRCKFVSSQEVCKACVLLEGLNKGLPKLGIGKSSKAKKMLEEYNAKQSTLASAIKDINDESKKNNCISKGKICRSSCKSHARVNIETSVHSNHSESCCNGSCGREKTNSECNSKVNVLLKEYGIEETQGEVNVDLISGTNKDTENVDFEVDLYDVEENVKEDDETCAGACGKIDSLHIGF